jgi:hypothetical protein
MFLDVTPVINNRKHCGRVAFGHYSSSSFLVTMNAGVQNLVISLGAMQRMFFSHSYSYKPSKNIQLPEKYLSTTRKF